MVTLTIVGPRAGSGKTTTAVNIAAELAVAKRRVALLDLDPQASATLALGHRPEPDPWKAQPVAVALDEAARGSLRLGRARNAFTVLWDHGWLTDEDVLFTLDAELRRRTIAIPVAV